MAKHSEKPREEQSEGPEEAKIRAARHEAGDEVEERVRLRFRHTDLEHPVIRELLAQSLLRAGRDDG